MATAAAKARSNGLDACRGFAALMVIVIHSYGGATGFTFIGYTLYGIPYDIVQHLQGAVYWFFALSGYLISLPFIKALTRGTPLPELKGYARRRILRIYPLYLVCLVIEMTSLHEWHQSPGILLAHVLLVQNLVPGQTEALYTVSWTLSLEVLFYVFMPLLVAIVRWFRREPVRPRSLAIGVGAIWVASALFEVVVGWGPETLHTYWLGYSFGGMVGMFCPGVLLAIAAQRDIEALPGGGRLERFLRRPWLIGAIVIGLLAGSTELLVMQGRQMWPLLSHHVDAVAYGLVIAVVLRSRLSSQWWVRALAWIGVISYGLYLWQGVVGDFWAARPKYFPLQQSLGAWSLPAIIAIVMIPVVPLSWLSWNYFEHPVVRWAHGKRPSASRSRSELPAVAGVGAGAAGTAVAGGAAELASLRVEPLTGEVNPVEEDDVDAAQITAAEVPGSSSRET